MTRSKQWNAQIRAYPFSFKRTGVHQDKLISLSSLVEYSTLLPLSFVEAGRVNRRFRKSRSCCLRINYISPRPAKLLFDMFSSTLYSLLSFINRISISFADDFTNRSSTPPRVSHISLSSPWLLSEAAATFPFSVILANQFSRYLLRLIVFWLYRYRLIPFSRSSSLPTPHLYGH